MQRRVTVAVNIVPAQSFVKWASSLQLCRVSITAAGWERHQLKSYTFPGVFTISGDFYVSTVSECVWETICTWVQGGSCEEVTFHPATLQHLQGYVGLANSPGDLLCCRRCALWHLLCQPWWGQWPSFIRQPQHYRQRHSCGDALHTWYDIFISTVAQSTKYFLHIVGDWSLSSR